MPSPLNAWLQRLLPTSAEAEPEAGARPFEEIGPYYDVLMSSVPYRQWVSYVEAILERMDACPQTALDLACGTGMVGAELKRRGCPRVFGVDLSEGMAQVAALRGRLPVAVQDARALGLRAETLDLVVSLYDSLNYILEPDGLRSCFRGVREALKAGGLLIFDLNTIRALALNLFTQEDLRHAAHLQYSWRSEWDARSRLCTVRMWFRWRAGDQEREFVEIHRQRGYADAEVRQLLREAGLTVRAAYDAYSFDPLHPRSTRAFYVAQR